MTDEVNGTTLEAQTSALRGIHPYPGLRPFTPDEKRFFFGRASLVDAVLTRLEEQRFIAVLGPSGCGKSSFVQAGIIAHLKDKSTNPGEVNWRIALCRPATQPAESLGRALVRAIPELGRLSPDTHSFEQLTAEINYDWAKIPNALLKTGLPENVNLLIVVDQFEEVFRYHHAKVLRTLHDGGHESSNVDVFLRSLLDLTSAVNSRVHVLLVIRSDFYGNCSQLDGFPEKLNAGGSFLMPALNREQLESVVVDPAEAAGARIEHALLRKLFHDLGDTHQQDQFSLIQHALRRVWAKAAENVDGAVSMVLRPDHYEGVGGVNYSLTMQAEQVFQQFDSRSMGVAEILFRCLTNSTPDGYVIRRPALVAEIAEVAGTPPENVFEVADAFRHHSVGFLSPPAESDLTIHTMLDLSSELVVRLWPRLRQWADEEARSGRTYQELADSAQLWSQREGELLTMPRLRTALDWWDSQDPTPAWSRRYRSEGDLERVKEFLTQSAAKNERRKPASRRKIFISYRRDDSIDATYRVYDRLVSYYAERQIILDIESIPAGINFREQVRRQIDSTAVLLVVIGERWPTKRLTERDDPVRLELETALEQNVTIIPLLVGKGILPAKQQLPNPIRRLVDLNAIELRAGADYETQVRRLMDALRSSVKPIGWRRLF